MQIVDAPCLPLVRLVEEGAWAIVVEVQGELGIAFGPGLVCRGQKPCYMSSSFTSHQATCRSTGEELTHRASRRRWEASLPIVQQYVVRRWLDHAYEVRSVLSESHAARKDSHIVVRVLGISFISELDKGESCFRKEGGIVSTLTSWVRADRSDGVETRDTDRRRQTTDGYKGSRGQMFPATSTRIVVVI